MTRHCVIRRLFLLACFAAANALHAQPDPTGPTWQLVAFKSSDGTARRPDDPANYTLHFAGDGRLAVRADCNRGSAAWTSHGTAELEIGPVAATRAMCPPESMSDQLLRDLSDVSGFAIQAGHLELTLKSGAGTYEFQAQADSANANGVASAAPAHAPNIAPAAKSGIDCAKAAPASAEHVVCMDPMLAALDAELARLYQLATAPKAKSAARVRSDQRAWLRTRDACAAQANARACLRDAYAARIADIRARSSAARSADDAGISRGPFPFRCDGIKDFVSTTFINTEPQQLVRIQAGRTVWILDSAPSASGARYVGANGALFWNHGREATFNEGVGKSDIKCQQAEGG